MILQQPRHIESHQITVRDLQRAELLQVLNYWFRSPPGYISSMGVDLKKMPTESKMRKNLAEKLISNRQLKVSKLNALAILYDNKPIGFHTLTSIQEGDSGIFHAHLWRKDLRGQGVGFHSYPKACRLFMERFNLQKIIFKTPVQNVGAIRVKEKLGIRCLGDVVIDFDILKSGTKGRAFELTREECFQKWP